MNCTVNVHKGRPLGRNCLASADCDKYVEQLDAIWRSILCTQGKYVIVSTLSVYETPQRQLKRT